MTLPTILLIAALIAFICSTCNVPSRINLVSIGLALATLAVLVPLIH